MLFPPTHPLVLADARARKEKRNTDDAIDMTVRTFGLNQDWTFYL